MIARKFTHFYQTKSKVRASFVAPSRIRFAVFIGPRKSSRINLGLPRNGVFYAHIHYTIFRAMVCLLLRNKGGQVAGYIIVSISNGNGEIDSLAVDTNFRRLGVAKKLGLSALENFREKGISTAIAQVRTTNEAAILFY